MTTIHSFPEEIIRHVLACAYLDSNPTNLSAQRTSKKGLAQAALVHSSWRQPAQGLLSHSLIFENWDHRTLSRFRQRGPRNVRCRHLSLVGLARADVDDLLTQFDEGGVKELRVVWRVPSHLFDAPALRDLHGLTLAGGYALPVTDSWPTKLQHLTLELGNSPIPPALLTASGSTLRSLDVSLATPAQVAALAAAAPPPLPRLTHLSVDKLRLSEAADPGRVTPALLASAIGLLPALRTLSLALSGLGPADLAALLHALPPAVRLASLQTTFSPPSTGHRADVDSGATWLASLRQCVRAPAFASRSEWELTVAAEHEPRWMGASDVKALVGVRAVEWERFVAGVAAKEVRFVPVVGGLGGGEEDDD